MTHEIEINVQVDLGTVIRDVARHLDGVGWLCYYTPPGKVAENRPGSMPPLILDNRAAAFVPMPASWQLSEAEQIEAARAEKRAQKRKGSLKMASSLFQHDLIDVDEFLGRVDDAFKGE